MKIQLVNPKPEQFFQSAIMDCYPPLGLLSIASFIDVNCRNVDVEILDAAVVPLEDLMAVIDADVVGISATIGTYRHAIEIAEKAKEKDAIVLLGGTYPSVMAETILSKRDCIDYVIAGDGEEAFMRYINGEAPEAIQNLVFRKGRHIYRNPLESLILEKLPAPDFRRVRVEDYFHNFKNRFRFLGERLAHSRELPVYTQKGCDWRLKGGCIFCSIFDKGYRQKSPEKAWREIRELVRIYEVDGIYDVSDNFVSNEEWLNRFAALRRDGDPYFVVMARVDTINEVTANLLSRLNCVRVFLGVECGDAGMLKRLRKGTRPAHNAAAVRLLGDKNIKVTAGIVLGAPGENSESLVRTRTLFESLISVGNLNAIDPNILIPLPGSRSFEDLIALPDMKAKYGERDCFDGEELQRDWVAHFCEVSFENLRVEIEELKSKVQFSLY